MDKTKGRNYYEAHNDRITSQKDRIRLDTNQSEPRGAVMALSVWIDSVYPQVLIFTAYILSFDRYGLLSLVCHETRSDIRVHDKAFNYIQILHEIKYEAFLSSTRQAGRLYLQKSSILQRADLILSWVCTIFKLSKTVKRTTTWNLLQLHTTKSPCLLWVIVPFTFSAFRQPRDGSRKSKYLRGNLRYEHVLTTFSFPFRCV